MNSRFPALLLAIVAGSAAAVPSYTVRDLGAIGIESEAHAINGTGIVVGLSYDTIAAHLAVRFDEPVPVPLLQPSGAQQQQAVGISDPGDIASMAFSLNSVGAEAFITMDGLPPIQIPDFIPRAIDTDGHLVGARPVLTNDNIYSETAAVWDGLTVTDLAPFSGSSWSIAHDISPDGTVVGAAIPAGALRPRAVLWGQAPVDLGTLGGESAQAIAINAAGTIVGVADTPTGHPHAFMFRLSGTSVAERIDLGALGGDASAARDINDHEQVVGASFGHAFLWHKGVIHDLNQLVADLDGWDLQSARAINNAGVIVGHGLHTPFGRRAFMLVPVIDCTADLSGDGILDLQDIQAFIAAFLNAQPAADLAEPFGIFDLADITAFVTAFLAGCP